MWATLGENFLVGLQRDCNLENKGENCHGTDFKMGSLQLCQSLVNGLYHAVGEASAGEVLF